LLHDREELLALVEQLVGLELREDRHPRNSKKGTPPVVLAHGRRGSGKTAALSEIFASYRNRVPEARLDLAGERYAAADGAGRDPGLPLLRWPDERPAGRPGTAHPSWDTPLLRLLRDAKWELELHIPGNGRLRFPRLDVAQLSVATWQREWKPDTEITVAQARHQLNRAREAVAGKDKAEHDVAVEWIADVLSEFSGTTVGFPADVFVKATVSAFLQRTLPGLSRTLTVLGKTLTRRGPDVPVKWHEQFDPREPGDGYDALITLARDWSAPGHRRRHEQRLVSAFLADLSAEYTGLAGMNRAVPPLLLLDNADASPAGERFLALARADRARAKGDGDPLVLVAAGPETFRLPGPPGGATAGRDESPTARRVALTPLADDAVDRELRQADSLELPPDLPLLIHRLTGGLPQGVRALAQAVTSAVPAHPPAGGPGGAGPLRSASLLDLPAAPGDREGAPGDGARAAGSDVTGAAGDGTRGAGARAKRGGATTRPSVGSLLLERLIPEATWRSRLALLSCARDDAEARALLAPLTPADRVRFAVSDAEELLEDNDWLDPRPPAGRERCRCAPPGAGFFIGDAFLRTLLHHQLAATGGPTAAAAAHVTLRDRYGAPGTGLLASTEPPRLYHCLALGEAEYVAVRLHAAFAGSDPQAWLAALVHAAAAPYPQAGPAAWAGGNGDDPRLKVALGGADAAARSSDPAYLSVNRLLHAAWYLHDPLVSPEGAAEEVIETLAGELRGLARTHPRGYGVLFRASRGWPRRLRAWDQSYCPTTEGE
jgi:hypothetical protein